MISDETLFVRIEIINYNLRESLTMLDAGFLFARVLLSCSVLSVGSRAALPQGPLAGVSVFSWVFPCLSSKLNYLCRYCFL